MDFTKPIQLFAQTTVSTVGFNHIVRQIQSRLKSADSSEELLKVNKTLCGEVTHRVPQLIEFCKQNDVIVFVSGKNSSNGKFLFGVCKQANPESHHISAPEEISQAWFNRVETVGISGATSTPNWLMQEVATKITAI